MPQNPPTWVNKGINRNAEPPKAKKIVQKITLLGEHFASLLIVICVLSVMEKNLIVEQCKR